MPSGSDGSLGNTNTFYSPKGMDPISSFIYHCSGDGCFKTAQEW